MKKFYIIKRFSAWRDVIASSFDYIVKVNFNNFSYEQHEILQRDSLLGACASFSQALEENEELCVKNTTSSIIIEYSLSEEDMFVFLVFDGQYPCLDIPPTNIWYFIKNESLGIMKEVFKKETRIYA